jgi:hypothetical protein
MTAGAAAGAILALGAMAGTASANPDQRTAVRAAAWLERTPAAGPGGQVADTIVALRSAGRSRATLAPRVRALARIAPRYADTAGGSAKVVLAAVAVGADPARFGGRDYLRGVTSRYAAGRYGATGFDQALSLLALSAAQRPVPRTAVRVTLAARGEGGWGFSLSPSARDSVDATGLMIEALRAAGVPARHPVLRAATAWMLAQRNARGGFASITRRGPTEANPTSNAIRALRAMGRPVPANTRAELRRLQDRSGAVRFTGPRRGSTVMATNDALVALSGRTLPVR